MYNCIIIVNYDYTIISLIKTIIDCDKDRDLKDDQIIDSVYYDQIVSSLLSSWLTGEELMSNSSGAGLRISSVDWCLTNQSNIS